jgi:hypothetical protein
LSICRRADAKAIENASINQGGAMVARPLIPAISSGASPVISPMTLIDGIDLAADLHGIALAAWP